MKFDPKDFNKCAMSYNPDAIMATASQVANDKLKAEGIAEKLEKLEYLESLMANCKTVYSPYLDFSWTTKKHRKDKYLGLLMNVQEING